MHACIAFTENQRVLLLRFILDWTKIALNRPDSAELGPVEMQVASQWYCCEMQSGSFWHSVQTGALKEGARFLTVCAAMKGIRANNMQSYL